MSLLRRDGRRGSLRSDHRLREPPELFGSGRFVTITSETVWRVPEFGCLAQEDAESHHRAVQRASEPEQLIDVWSQYRPVPNLASAGMASATNTVLYTVVLQVCNKMCRSNSLLQVDSDDQ